MSSGECGVSGNEAFYKSQKGEDKEPERQRVNTKEDEMSGIRMEKLREKKQTENMPRSRKI